jgi:uncharacterized protein (UPF0335 family)
MSEALGGNAAKAVKSYVARIEKLREERAAINADISEVFKEVKADGLNAKALRRLISDRARAARMDHADWEAEENDYDMYQGAMG